VFFITSGSTIYFYGINDGISTRVMTYEPVRMMEIVAYNNVQLQHLPCERQENHKNSEQPTYGSYSILPIISAQFIFLKIYNLAHWTIYVP